MWHAGLRGAIAFASALSFPSQHRDTIVNATSWLCLFSTFAMGATTVPLLRRLRIPYGVVHSAAAQSESVVAAMRASAGKRGLAAIDGWLQRTLFGDTFAAEVDALSAAATDRMRAQLVAAAAAEVRARGQQLRAGGSSGMSTPAPVLSAAAAVRRSAASRRVCEGTSGGGAMGDSPEAERRALFRDGSERVTAAVSAAVNRAIMSPEPCGVSDRTAAAAPSDGPTTAVWFAPHAEDRRKGGGDTGDYASKSLLLPLSHVTEQSSAAPVGGRNVSQMTMHATLDESPLMAVPTTASTAAAAPRPQRRAAPPPLVELDLLGGGGHDGSDASPWAALLAPAAAKGVTGSGAALQALPLARSTAAVSTPALPAAVQAPLLAAAPAPRQASYASWNAPALGSLQTLGASVGVAASPEVDTDCAVDVAPDVMATPATINVSLADVAAPPPADLVSSAVVAPPEALVPPVSVAPPTALAAMPSVDRATALVALSSSASLPASDFELPVPTLADDPGQTGRDNVDRDSMPSFASPLTPLALVPRSHVHVPPSTAAVTGRRLPPPPPPAVLHSARPSPVSVKASEAGALHSVHEHGPDLVANSHDPAHAKLMAADAASLAPPTSSFTYPVARLAAEPLVHACPPAERPRDVVGSLEATSHPTSAASTAASRGVEATSSSSQLLSNETPQGILLAPFDGVSPDPVPQPPASVLRIDAGGDASNLAPAAASCVGADEQIPGSAPSSGSPVGAYDIPAAATRLHEDTRTPHIQTGCAAFDSSAVVAPPDGSAPAPDPAATGGCGGAGANRFAQEVHGGQPHLPYVQAPEAANDASLTSDLAERQLQQQHQSMPLLISACVTALEVKAEQGHQAQADQIGGRPRSSSSTVAPIAEVAGAVAQGHAKDSESERPEEAPVPNRRPRAASSGSTGTPPLPFNPRPPAAQRRARASSAASPPIAMPPRASPAPVLSLASHGGVASAAAAVAPPGIGSASPPSISLQPQPGQPQQLPLGPPLSGSLPPVAAPRPLVAPTSVAPAAAAAAASAAVSSPPAPRPPPSLLTINPLIIAGGGQSPPQAAAGPPLFPPMHAPPPSPSLSGGDPQAAALGSTGHTGGLFSSRGPLGGGFRPASSTGAAAATAGVIGGGGPSAMLAAAASASPANLFNPFIQSRLRVTRSGLQAASPLAAEPYPPATPPLSPAIAAPDSLMGGVAAVDALEGVAAPPSRPASLFLGASGSPMQ